MPALQLMADMFKNPAFDAAELVKLKTEQLASIESYKNEPQFLASKRLSEINNVYPKGHPLYEMSIAEEEEAIKKVMIEDVKAFYNEFYGIGKSILIGIGDLDSDMVKASIEKEFAAYKSKHPYERIAQSVRCFQGRERGYTNTR